MKIALPIVIVSIIVIVSLAVVYVILSKKNVTPTQPASTSIQQENVDAKALKTDDRNGAYLDYSDTVIADTPGTKILFFHAPWCPQCRELDKSITTDGIPNGVTVIKVDYDSHQALRKKYGVTLQTTLVKVDDAGNKISSYVAYEEPQFSAVERELLN
ncbi:MAG: thioredoxin family protein [Candidatus Saccharimonadales bacterium]